VKSAYQGPTAENGSGTSGQTTSSATRRSAAHASRDPTGTATMMRAGPSVRTACTAACIVEPVARPSSTSNTVRRATSSGGRSPRYARSRRAISSCSSRVTRSMTSGETEYHRITSSFSTRVPPLATAPIASSSWPGTPSLRTTKTSSGAPRARATSNATGTPPRGSARTAAGCPAKRDRSRASARPASRRSAYPCRAANGKPAMPSSLGGRNSPATRLQHSSRGNLPGLLAVFDLPRTGLGRHRLGQRHAHLEHAIGERRLDVVQGDAIGQRHRPEEAAVCAFAAIERIRLLFGFGLALARDRQLPVDDLDLDVFLLHARQIDLRHELLVALEDVDLGRPGVGAPRRPAQGRPGREVEDAIEFRRQLPQQGHVLSRRHDASFSS